MKKKILAIVLVVCLVAALIPNATATGTYADVDNNDWYADEIMYVTGKGLMNGVGNDAFDPKGTVTRAMVWTTLARLEGVDTSKSDPWYLAGQKWAMANGISDGTMALENVTREQLVTMMYRYAQLKMYDVSVGEETNILSYEDIFSVSEWAIEAFQWACGAGVINGVNGNLLPKQGATRAELAVMLTRFDKTTVGKYEPTIGEPCVYSNYTPNDNGTHIGTCKKCGLRVLSDCQFVGDVCKLCGYDKSAVARIGYTYYATLAEAVAAGGNIVVLKDIALAESITVAEDKTVTLDLNGKVISHEKAQTDAYQMILNKGTLTITDSGVGGKITYKDTTEYATDNNHVSNTITNNGTLIIKGGIIENASGENVADMGYPHAIDSLSSAASVSLVVEGGEIRCDYYTAIRQFCNSTTNTNTAIITGGEIYGRVDFQKPNSGKLLGSLTIEGGTFNPPTYDEDCWSMFIFGAGGDASEMKLSISGGHFVNIIEDDHPSLPVGAGFDHKFISGGTFEFDPSAYVANTHKAVKNGSVWNVVERLPGEVLNTAEAQAALDAAAPGTVIQLSEGVDYGTLKFRANPGHSNTTLEDIADAWAYNYNRSIEDVTILGATGAKVDGIVFETGAQPGDCNNRVTVKNLVIDGVEFTDALPVSAAGYNAPIMITTSNATVDGLTVKNCKLIGNNAKLNLVYFYGADGSKNVTLTGNTVDGIARLCELRGTENVTITGNTIKNTYEHGMLLAGSGYSGNVTIAGNTADGIAMRFVRMSGAGDATVVITDNTISKYLGGDADYIKVTDSTGTPTIENNTLVSVGSTKAAQAFLDVADEGDTIILAEGTYGDLFLRQSAKSVVIDNDSLGGDGYAEGFRIFKDITIKAKEGDDVVVNSIKSENGTIGAEHRSSYIAIRGLRIEGIDFTGGVQILDGNVEVDGLKIENCTMTGDDYAYENGRLLAIIMGGHKEIYLDKDAAEKEVVMVSGLIKNITISNCTISHVRQVIELRSAENVTMSGNKISDVRLAVAQLSGGTGFKYSGKLEFTNNTVTEANGRFVRIAGVADNTKIIVTGNDVAFKASNPEDEVFKADGMVEANCDITVENNTWPEGKTVVFAN